MKHLSLFCVLAVLACVACDSDDGADYVTAGMALDEGMAGTPGIQAEPAWLIPVVKRVRPVLLAS